jgi:uncharacterized membrane protein
VDTSSVSTHLTTARRVQALRVQALRVQSVDLLRGMVMIVMALDHVRDFFHSAAMTGSPTNLATTTPATFLTRWITHFCAPVFLLLAGVSARLWMERKGRGKTDLSRFLVTRGLWLIFLEVVVMRLAFDFTYDRQAPILLITLWALGMSMISLAGLVYLPVRVIATLSVAVICLHNLTDRVQAATFGNLAWMWNVLHQPGVILVHGTAVVVGYPLASFAATMALGYCLGGTFLLSEDERRRFLARVGVAMFAAFILLRAINVFGDPFPWKPQSTAVMTLLSFLNVTKYPASLDFLLMTLGPAFLLLARLDRIRVSESNPVLIFGRVPLFYFLGHFFLAHAVLVFATWLRYGVTPFLLLPPPSFGGSRDAFPKDFGYGLGTVSCVWILVVVLMYPACKWFADVKGRSRRWWSSYL